MVMSFWEYARLIIFTGKTKEIFFKHSGKKKSNILLIKWNSAVNEHSLKCEGHFKRKYLGH